MRNGKHGWIFGIVFFLAAISLHAGENPAVAIINEDEVPAPLLPKGTTENYIAGVSLYEQGRFKEAVREFRDAYEKSADWKILYYVGKCEMALKRYGVAVEVFEEYWEKGADNMTKLREREVLRIFDTLAKRTGYVEITGMNSAQIFIDGLERGVLPLSKKIAISSDAKHRVLIRQGKTVFFDRFIQIAPEQELSISVPQGDSAVEVLPVVPHPIQPKEYTAIRAANDSRMKLRTVAMGVIGGGVLALAGSLVMGSNAKEIRDELRNICDSNTTCVETPARTQKYTEAVSAANAATVLFATGATMVVVGTALLVGMGRKLQRAGLSESVMVQVQPTQGGALVFRRRF